MIPYSRPKLSDLYTLSQSKLLENHTLHSGTYLYSRDRAGVGAEGAFPTFLAVDVRTLNVQLQIFKVLMKDGEFTCFDDILARSSSFLKPKSV